MKRQPRYFKGYWMITNRCNLRCSYCVLENAPHQLRAELSLEHKKALVSHLYTNLNFRRLTLSGGEALLIGKHPPREFIALLNHIRQYRSSNPADNLQLEVYTNGSYCNDDVVAAMHGVVDVVAVTIDSVDDEVLRNIGRKHRGEASYLDNIVKVISQLTACGITIKLHSVVSTKNIEALASELRPILAAVHDAAGVVNSWKFYQYMSYDAPEVDKTHTVTHAAYADFCTQAQQALQGTGVKLHFKDNQEMNASLFNILSYGNAQYMVAGDTWSTSRRTEDLRNYASMQELFARNAIDEERFSKFHEL